MALWPFRRKSGRKRSRSGAALSDAEGAPPPPRSQTANDAHGLADSNSAPARTASKKKQRTEGQPPANKKLQRRPRTYSFSPGRNDSIRVADKDNATSGGPPGRGRPTRLPPGGQIDEEKGEEDAWEWQRAPTLYNTRNGEKMKRKKSSKRRRQDPDREAEVKAMAGLVPVRPATDNTHHGHPTKKDSKRIRTGAGRNSPPTSDISLPIPESIDSRMSSDSEHASYKISALDSLAPRPTLRCSTNPRYGPPPNNSEQPGRTPSQRRKLTEPGSVPEATLRAHKRIDSLADDLDASDLRELMERDKRRRERKVQRDQERMQRRLTRKAEQQRREEAEARKSGTPPPQNLDRGVMGREVEGQGIETTSAVVTSSRRRSSDAASRQASNKTPEQGRASPEQVEAEPRQPSQEHEAVGHFHRVSSIPPEEPEAAETKPAEPKAPITPPPESPKVKAKPSFLRYRTSFSKTSLVSDGKQTLSTLPPKSESSEQSRRGSETSGRGKKKFSSLFRWGSLRRSRRRASKEGPPPSFSNTSREEMMQAEAQARAAAHAHALAKLQQGNSSEHLRGSSQSSLPITTMAAAAATAPKKPAAGFPKRTRSRFREDLPELPVSPPDSRQASVEPEAEPPLPAVSEVKSDENSPEGTPAIPIRNDTSASEREREREHHTIDETMRQTPSSIHRSDQASPQPHSVSLASIDSEGSWLSGRMNKRSSMGMGMGMGFGMGDGVSKSYASKIQRRSQPSSFGTGDNNTDDGRDGELADDEYLASLATPSQASPEPRHRDSSRGHPVSDDDEPMNMSMDEDDENTGMKWGTAGKRQPAVHTVFNPEMMRSREGLLNSVEEADANERDARAGSGGNSSPSDAGETPKVEHATSVDLGRKAHARQVSAGSAKLLDITGRQSVDNEASQQREDEPMVM